MFYGDILRTVARMLPNLLNIAHCTYVGTEYCKNIKRIIIDGLVNTDHSTDIHAEYPKNIQSILIVGIVCVRNNTFYRYSSRISQEFPNNNNCWQGLCLKSQLSCNPTLLTRRSL